MRSPISPRVKPKLRPLWRGFLLLVLGGLLGNAVATFNVTGHAAVATSAKHNSSGNSSNVPTTDQEKLVEQAIKTVDPAVVEVINPGVGLGSGIIMDSHGDVVTNHHVVAGAHSLEVVLTDGRKIGARILGTDVVDDLAVIKIQASKLPTASFGHSDDLRVGQTMLAIGNPLGIVNTVTEGIVSARRSVPEGKNARGVIVNAIQTSAAINPGNSGGALINLAGQVVGIPTLTAVDPEFNAPAAGVGFAVPAATVKDITGQIIKYGKVVHSHRGALDVSVVSQAITPQIAQQNNLPVDHGVLIHQVVPNGPAAKAGLKAGDIITKVNGTPITSYDGLLLAVTTQKPGTTVSVAYVDQQGGKHTAKVKLGELNVNG